MTLPPRKAKKQARSDRWRSQKHCNFIRSYTCCVCHSDVAIEVAHVRIGSDAGMGRKPSDDFTVPLCKLCHQRQHNIGERSFWKDANIDPHAMIDAFIQSSPERLKIQLIRSNREADYG